jgi:hypothetical protein
LSTSAPVAVAVFAFALISMASCMHLKPPPIPSGQCSGSAAENKAVVLAFHDLALVRRSPREAYAMFATMDMIEHTSDISGGMRDVVVACKPAFRIDQRPASNVHDANMRQPHDSHRPISTERWSTFDAYRARNLFKLERRLTLSWDE